MEPVDSDTQDEINGDDLQDGRHQRKDIQSLPPFSQDTCLVPIADRREWDFHAPLGVMFYHAEIE